MNEENSLNNQVSGTALATAFLRALAAYDPRTEIRGNDSLAEIFLVEEQKKPLKDFSARTWVMQNKLTPGAYEFMVARTAFFDQIVEQALKDNIPQIVFLGAGYDSRSYRYEQLIRDTMIFELDTKPTQERKRECLLQSQISISTHIRFVPVNFETDNLLDKLNEAGFDREKKTLFVWEGVTYYLSEKTVNDMLELMKSNSPSGSSVCFDYVALSDRTLNENNAAEMRKLMHSKYPNEPTRFGIPAGKIESFLAERGYSITKHLTGDDMTQTYLPGDNGKVPPLFCLVHAEMK
jgi:methyltransferase (TIGR00027 family)